MGLDAVAKFGLKLIANKNGVQVYQGLSKNGTRRITAAYRDGVPYKLITQRRTPTNTYGNWIVQNTRVKNFDTGNVTTINSDFNKVQKLTQSETVDRAGNVLLRRKTDAVLDVRIDKNGRYYIAKDANGNKLDFLSSYVTRYNPQNPLQNITYQQYIISAGQKPERLVVSNGWKGINPGPYSNWHLETSAEYVNRTSNVNLNKLGYIS